MVWFGSKVRKARKGRDKSMAGQMKARVIVPAWGLFSGQQPNRVWEAMVFLLPQEKEKPHRRTRTQDTFLLASGSNDPKCRVICSSVEIFYFNLLFPTEVVLEESQKVAFFTNYSDHTKLFPPIISRLERNQDISPQPCFWFWKILAPSL